MDEFWYGLLEGIVFAVCCVVTVIAFAMLAA